MEWRDLKSILLRLSKNVVAPVDHPKETTFGVYDTHIFRVCNIANNHLNLYKKWLEMGNHALYYNLRN